MCYKVMKHRNIYKVVSSALLFLQPQIFVIFGSVFFEGRSCAPKYEFETFKIFFFGIMRPLRLSRETEVHNTKKKKSQHI